MQIWVGGVCFSCSLTHPGCQPLPWRSRSQVLHPCPLKACVLIQYRWLCPRVITELDQTCFQFMRVTGLARPHYSPPSHGDLGADADGGPTSPVFSCLMSSVMGCSTCEAAGGRWWCSLGWWTGPRGVRHHGRWWIHVPTSVWLTRKLSYFPDCLENPVVLFWPLAMDTPVQTVLGQVFAAWRS